jgi:hypothetical protein
VAPDVPCDDDPGGLSEFMMASQLQPHVQGRFDGVFEMVDEIKSKKPGGVRGNGPDAPLVPSIGLGIFSGSHNP